MCDFPGRTAHLFSGYKEFELKEALCRGLVQCHTSPSGGSARTPGSLQMEFVTQAVFKGSYKIKTRCGQPKDGCGPRNALLLWLTLVHTLHHQSPMGWGKMVGWPPAMLHSMTLQRVRRAEGSPFPPPTCHEQNISDQYSRPSPTRLLNGRSRGLDCGNGLLQQAKAVRDLHAVFNTVSIVG